MKRTSKRSRSPQRWKPGDSSSEEEHQGRHRGSRSRSHSEERHHHRRRRRSRSKEQRYDRDVTAWPPPADVRSGRWGNDAPQQQEVQHRPSYQGEIYGNSNYRDAYPSSNRRGGAFGRKPDIRYLEEKYKHRQDAAKEPLSRKIWGDSPPPPRMKDMDEVWSEEEEDDGVDRQMLQPGKAIALSKGAKSDAEEDEVWVERKVQKDDEDVVGPQKPMVPGVPELSSKDFGEALRPGEGKGMYAFVERGERIPRRGEVGLSSNAISDYEKMGYIMSGDRHQRMTAIRLRKENQVYSADERRALLQTTLAEKSQRENVILAGFREMIQSKLGDYEQQIAAQEAEKKISKD